MMTREQRDSLRDRVEAFQERRLPGQPMGMYMGTAYLVNDLWAAVVALYDRADWAAARARALETTLLHYQARIAEKDKDMRRVEAELKRLGDAFDEREHLMAEDEVTISTLKAEVARLREALE